MKPKLTPYEEILEITFEPAKSEAELKKIAQLLVNKIEDQLLSDLYKGYELVLISQKYIENSCELLFGKTGEGSYKKSQIEKIFQTPVIKNVKKQYLKSLEECILSQDASSLCIDDSSYEGFLGRPIIHSNESIISPIQKNTLEIQNQIQKIKKFKSLNHGENNNVSFSINTRREMTKKKSAMEEIQESLFKSRHTANSVVSNITSYDCLSVDICMDKIMQAGFNYEIDEIVLYFFILMGPQKDQLHFSNIVDKMDHGLLKYWSKTVSIYENYLFSSSIKQWDITKNFVKIAKDPSYFVFEKMFSLLPTQKWKDLFLILSNPEKINIFFPSAEIKINAFQENEIMFSTKSEGLSLDWATSFWNRWKVNRSFLINHRLCDQLSVTMERTKNEIDFIEFRIEVFPRVAPEISTFKITTIMSKINVKIFKSFFLAKIIDSYKKLELLFDRTPNFLTKGLEGFLERLLLVLTKQREKQFVIYPEKANQMNYWCHENNKFFATYNISDLIL